ncbi:MAG: 2-oxo acid dehydrogenase subunit E2 [Candidatus Nanopelagicales bacterium]
MHKVSPERETNAATRPEPRPTEPSGGWRSARSRGTLSAWPSRCRVRPVVTLTLSFDHRCIDGALGSEVLTRIAGFLADPAMGLAGATAPR